MKLYINMLTKYIPQAKSEVCILWDPDSSLCRRVFECQSIDLSFAFEYMKPEMKYPAKYSRKGKTKLVLLQSMWSTDVGDVQPHRLVHFTDCSTDG